MQTLFVNRCVAEINDDVNRYDDEIQNVGDEYVIDLSRNYLGGNACNVARGDEQDKGQTCSSCSSCFIRLYDIKRPREAEANQHDCF